MEGWKDDGDGCASVCSWAHGQVYADVSSQLSLMSGLRSSDASVAASSLVLGLRDEPHWAASPEAPGVTRADAQPARPEGDPRVHLRVRSGSDLLTLHEAHTHTRKPRQAQSSTRLHSDRLWRPLQMAHGQRKADRTPPLGDCGSAPWESPVDASVSPNLQ